MEGDRAGERGRLREEVQVTRGEVGCHRFRAAYFDPIRPEPDLSAESTPTGRWCQMKEANIFTEKLPNLLLSLARVQQIPGTSRQELSLASSLSGSQLYTGDA